MKKGLLILLCLPMIGFGQWQKITINNSWDINAVNFVNDTLGYAVGLNGLGIKSVDGGYNWSVMNTGLSGELMDVLFFNNDTGFILQNGGSNWGQTAKVYKTIDGGNSWSYFYQVEEYANGQSLGHSFSKVSDMNFPVLLNNIYINSTDNSAYVISKEINSTSGAASTIASNAPNSQNRTCYDSYVHPFNHPSGNEIFYYTCENGFFARTTEYGSNGHFITLQSLLNTNATLVDLNSVAKADSNLIIVGRDGLIIKTNWNLNDYQYQFSLNDFIVINGANDTTLNDIEFIDNYIGYVVGEYGVVKKTIDKGNTWDPSNLNTNFHLNDIELNNECTGWIVGNAGTMYLINYEQEVSKVLCENSSNYNLFTALDFDALSLGGIWTDSAGNQVSPNIDPSTLALGMHSFYYSFYLCNEVKESVVNISIYEVPDLSTTVLNNVLCSGDNTGSAQVNMLNGSIIYANCLWSNGSNNAVASNLLAGSYTVSVTDTNGCSASTSVTITQPSIITPIITIINATCYGGNDASIVATVTGGVPPFQYSLGGGLSQASGTFSNLTAGTYFIDVTDINGCSSNQTVIITEPNPLFVNAFSTDISCFGYCDGSAFSMPSGGTPPYSYLWSNGNITDNISGLCAGAYVVNITDANNCVNIETVVISEPLPLVSNNTINGCDSVLIGSNYYTISGAYTDTLTSVNGCDSVVNTNLTIEQNTSSYDTLSVGASIVWNGMPLNVSGDYSATLINSVGCDSIVNLNLTVTTTGISEIANNKSNLVKITDVLGKETPYRRNTPLFYIYNDGTVEKKVVVE